jgi:RimJ/RimL family protein N-acetyltransferase
VNEIGDVTLRDVQVADVGAFFAHQLDPVANRMAAFVSHDPTDRDAFADRWHRLLTDRSVVKQTVLADGRVAGHVVAFERFGRPEVSYWIDPVLWGRGVASVALVRFLESYRVRPVYARAVKDNVASLRVLEKCGFVVVGEDEGFSPARGHVVGEYVLELRDGAG